jgi:AraC-like DNA-binding protein
MFLVFEDRASDSPLIERVWRCRSERAGTFLSVAATHCELVLTRRRGRIRVTLRGPETRPSTIHCPAEGEWIGIRLATGAWLPRHPTASLMDRRDLELRVGVRCTFELDGGVWEYPAFDDAEALVAGLARAGLVTRDPAVAAALAGDADALSRRTVQRHFRLATGMTARTWRQIQRARHAAVLLRAGCAIAEAVHLAGYYDQAHLTRSLQRLIGATPRGIQRQERQLSFLYKPGKPADAMLVGLVPGSGAMNRSHSRSSF